ncbi:MAG: TraB/GumN family protein [Lysobacteraceae bacterium]|nr:MAG: TraB/GumN family protein [Xanthomonadaceae bacterium]
MPPRRLAGLLLCLSIFPLSAIGEVLPQSEPNAAKQLAVVEVQGEMPGPGLWRVAKGDHVLWILGTLSPLPAKVEWRSTELEARLAEAEAIINQPRVSMTSGAGMWRTALLMPSLLGARKNPDGATLQDVVSPELYARWASLKPTYLGRDRAVERWRPVFAAEKLQRRAADSVGLVFGSPASALAHNIAEQRKLPVINPMVDIVIDDLKPAIKEFKANALGDSDCFERTLRRFETDLDLLRARANAWAVGDVPLLRVLHEADPESACLDAVLSASALQKRGLDELPGKKRKVWLAAAEQALDEHRISIGLLPISELLKPDGYLSDLASRGYVVTAPDEDEFEDESEVELAPTLDHSPSTSPDFE